MDTGIFSFTGDKREDFVLDKKALMKNERSKDLDND
jgi:NADH-quinone oxidoreductase subunit I